ncbi:PepSY-associated TM helix domain-containing protein, partial [Nostoc sp. NIES-2111]
MAARKIRKLALGVHLWLGVILALYGVALGFSGAVITFKDELKYWQNPELHDSGARGFGADPDRVLAQVRERYPDWQPLSFTWPHDQTTNWMIFLLRGSQSLEVYVNPETGVLVGTHDPKSGWLGWIETLHTNLAWGRNGRLANGYGAIGIGLLCLTGLYLVWPRLRHLRALLLSRPGQGSHFALGAFSLVFLLGLAFTGAYYTWSKNYIAVVNAVLPRSGELRLPPLAAGAAKVSLWRLMEEAQKAMPGKTIHRFPIPNAKFPLRVTFREASFAEFHRVSAVVLDPRTGAVLQVQPLAQRPWGDWFLGWLSGFHFGVFGGWPVK